MLSKIYRFHGRKSLDYIYRKGKTVRGEFVSLRYSASRRQDFRVAVVVSKKVSKSAVIRNRIRRRVYEVARLYRKDRPSELRFDIVISVFDERVASMKPAELDKILTLLFNKISK